MNSLTLDREAQFRRVMPDYATIGKSLLYIGGKPARLQMLDLFHEAGYEIDILEAWGPNVTALEAWNETAKRARYIVNGDALDLTLAGTHDVAMWWHGPEHVICGHLGSVLARLERAARRLVILASPWGRYEQGASGGNPFEAHRAHLYPADFHEFGYSTDAIGQVDRKGSNLIAWKRIT